MTLSSSSTASPLRQQANTRSQSRARVRPAALAQHFGVVDFLDLELPAAGRRPELVDAALGQQIFDRPRQQEQQRAPVVGAGGGAHSQRPDEAPVQQIGELDDGRIRPRREHGRRSPEWSDGRRAASPSSPRGARTAETRRVSEPSDRRVGAGVERHRADSGLAGACKFGERCALIARHRLPLRRLRRSGLGRGHVWSRPAGSSGRSIPDSYRLSNRTPCALRQGARFALYTGSAFALRASAGQAAPPHGSTAPRVHTQCNSSMSSRASATDRRSRARPSTCSWTASCAATSPTTRRPRS